MGFTTVTTYSYDYLNHVQTITPPALNGSSFLGPQPITYHYDAVGNRTQAINGRGQTTTFTYDEANRLTGISYSDGTHSVTYAYDDNGRRALMTDGTGSTFYVYDYLGRVTSIGQPNGTVGYTYDADGNRTSITIPNAPHAITCSGVSGSVSACYNYDLDNRETSVRNWNNVTAVTYSYDPAGREVGMTNGNTDAGVMAYDGANRLISVTYVNRQNFPLVRYDYTYDADDNRISEETTSGTTPPSAGTLAPTWKYYQYDAKNERCAMDTQSQPASCPTDTMQNSHEIGYLYDDSGNRIAVVPPTGQSVQVFGYNAADELTSSPGYTFTYDKDGNRATATQGSTTLTYSYDAANYLTGITGGAQASSYTYNGDHSRTGMTVGTTPTQQVLDLAKSTPTVIEGTSTTSGNSSTTYYLRDAAGLVDQYALAGGDHYVLTDGHGSLRLSSNADGSYNRQEYDPFGAVSSGNLSSAFGFTGAQTDSDSGLIYLRARMYDPSTGTFLQRDVYPINAANPRSPNRYNYSQENPINAKDPSGYNPAPDLTPHWDGNCSDACESYIADWSANVKKKEALSQGVRASFGPSSLQALGSVVANGGVLQSKLAPGIIAQGVGNIIAQGGGNIISTNSGNIIAQSGGNIIAQGGGNIIAQGGGNVISNDGGSLISEDGAGLTSKTKLISEDGGGVISNDGGSLSSQDGAGFIGHNGSA